MKERLGWGQDGVVFSTNRMSAVKAFRHPEQYHRERDVYYRLAEHGMTSVCGVSIPRLIETHEELFVVEIEVVDKPYVIDFAGAYLDSPPDFPAEIAADADERRRADFGDDWPFVCSIMSEFRRIGVHLNDVSTSNIALHSD